MRCTLRRNQTKEYRAVKSTRRFFSVFGSMNNRVPRARHDRCGDLVRLFVSVLCVGLQFWAFFSFWPQVTACRNAPVLLLSLTVVERHVERWHAEGRNAADFGIFAAIRFSSNAGGGG